MLLALLQLCCRVRRCVRVRNGDREIDKITVCGNLVKRKEI